jgi:myo-inositol-1(or 4)-monophosphatase
VPAGAPEAVEDRALLVAAAEEAGAVALRFHGKPVRSWEKPGALGPVSEADLAVNAALETRLRPLRPTYAWLSEEDADDPVRGGSERVFVVDPIDGTRAFLKGEPGFSIALAVVERGAVTAAAVHLPARGETYAAHLGGGATLDGLPIRPSGRTAPDGAQALAAKAAFDAAHWPHGAPHMRRHFRPSLAWRLCLVAAGRFDATMTFRPAWEWDIAAGALIAEEAGCRVSDGRGGRLMFNLPSARLEAGVIVAPPALHAALVRRREGR